jgi:hypothetical protein
MRNDSITSALRADKNCIVVNDSCIFKTRFFPFDFTNYNTQKLRAFFEKSITVDSVENNNNGYITRIYKFKNKLSEVRFLVKITDPEPYFYLDRAVLRNNIFPSKNGVKIDMSRAEFFKSINSKSVGCDTFIIQEGDLATYYYFIFEKDRLKTIEIQQSE